MRQRFNRNAICSSDNYKASKKAHLSMLHERHDHFSFMVISCKNDEDDDSPTYTTITISSTIENGSVEASKKSANNTIKAFKA